MLAFLMQTVVISLSGVMAPGPVTAAIIAKGSKNPHAGAMMAIGHGIIEFPLIFLLLFGLSNLFTHPIIQIAAAFIGGSFLYFIAFDLFKNINRVDSNNDKSSGKSPLVSGILLSAGNPYFFIWWVSVGITLINSAKEYGTIGLLLFMLAHWLCDLVWLYFLSFTSFKGGQFFGKGFHKLLFAACGLLLVIFGTKFMIDGVRFIIDYT